MLKLATKPPAAMAEGHIPGVRTVCTSQLLPSLAPLLVIVLACHTGLRSCPRPRAPSP